MNDDSSLVEKPPEPGSHDKARRLIGALAANLVPVAGVLFWGWSAGLLMLVYWLENVVIGVFNVLRMGAAGAAQGAAGLLSCLFVIPFFCVHYGMFCAVHGVFVWAMFGKGLENSAGVADPFSPSFLPALFADQPGLWAALATIVLWQGALFALFLIRREYRDTDPMTEMSAPYGRIVVLHLVIIAGGFIVLSLGQPWLGVLLLALGKTALELGGFAFGQQQKKTRAAWAQSRAQLEALMKRRAAPDARPPR
jgi:hypothetical protein